jgi:4-diphosphocytidyl-2-C-methyl-D-erythritol kinase
MPVTVRSHGKINLGLLLGAPRPDGFHELRTCYTTIALHDTVRVERQRGTGIQLRAKPAKGCIFGDDAAAEMARRFPTDESNTCYRVVERLLKRVREHSKVSVTVEKMLPVQGGLGAASSNAVATLLAAERELRFELPAEERYAICAEIGSDLPQFLIGGLTLGVGRGEQVFPLPDAAADTPLHLAVVVPEVGVSTPKAFRDWDGLMGHAGGGSEAADKPLRKSGHDGPRGQAAGLTGKAAFDRLDTFSHTIYRWLSHVHTGVPAQRRSLAEAPLLDLVRAGIENDFERVVFPQHPELREIKRALERAGATFSSLSGSGSTLFGAFDTKENAEAAAQRFVQDGRRACVTSTLSRREYWQSFWVK